LQRSLKIRKSSEFISENAMKIRKAFFCNETTGFFSRDVKTKQMDIMGNPDMMNNMLK